MKKFLFLISLIVALGFSGQALAITVGGVTWDNNSVLDFNAFSLAIHQDINATTGVVSGYGIVTTMNGTGQSVFVSGGELTFTFGDFTPLVGAPLPNGTAGSTINYGGGWVDLFVDMTPNVPSSIDPNDATTLNFANTSDGTLWLGMVGHADPISGATLVGLETTSGLSGTGQLDVVDGLAKDYFINTNMAAFGADLNFSNSFTQFLTGSLLSAEGTGNYSGDSVPEPATMLLFGIGLLGLAGMGRKKA